MGACRGRTGRRGLGGGPALGRDDEAVACFREAVRLQPGYAAAQKNLETALKASAAKQAQ